MELFEKVEKGLECCHINSPECFDCPYYKIGCADRMQQDAFFVLRAQRERIKELEAAYEPVEPIISGDGKTFETAKTWWYSCGACGAAIDMNDRHCRKCGREVKWE